MSLFEGCLMFLVWVFILAEFVILIYLFVPLFHKRHPVYLYIFLPLFVVCFCLLCFSFYKTVFTNPGSPSQKINSFYHNIQQIRQKSIRDQWIKYAIRSGNDMIQSTKNVRFCFKCNKIKQPRTHHCKTCGKCILRMDHHCPWIANCVGKYNHKYFLLFLFYGTISFLLVVMAVFVYYRKDQPLEDDLSDVKLYILYGAAFGAVVFGLSVIILLVYQMYLIKFYTRNERDCTRLHIQQPFRKGSFVQNMRQIMGQSMWLLPSAPFKVQNPLHSHLQL